MEPVRLKHRASNIARRRRQQQRAARDNEFFYQVRYGSFENDYDPGENYPHTEPDDYDDNNYYGLYIECPNCCIEAQMWIQKRLLQPKTMICPNCLTRQKFTPRRER